MANEQSCRHFNGLVYEQCESGISYMDVRDTSQTPYNWPCFGRGKCATQCDKFEHYTAEEIAEHQRQIDDFVRGVTAFENRESDTCPHCGKTVTALRQVGRCVYTSCGCRLWQGKVPKAWAS